MRIPEMLSLQQPVLPVRTEKKKQWRKSNVGGITKILQAYNITGNGTGSIGH
jgi:hypothetical protein